MPELSTLWRRGSCFGDEQFVVRRNQLYLVTMYLLYTCLVNCKPSAGYSYLQLGSRLLVLWQFHNHLPPCLALPQRLQCPSHI